jgi:hypothetical protein
LNPAQAVFLLAKNGGEARTYNLKDKLSFPRQQDFNNQTGLTKILDFERQRKFGLDILVSLPASSQ